jgi:hypothetical protein
MVLMEYLTLFDSLVLMGIKKREKMTIVKIRSCSSCMVHIKGFSPNDPTTKFDPWKNSCDVEILFRIFKPM